MGTGNYSLAMAPAALKRTLLAHIQREAAVADSGGLIMAKMNSLSDPDVIAALYAASRAGVTVLLNVRGVCLLRPQVPGLSDTIRVVSVVGRFLEHSRIAYFRNGGAEQVYLASADWMPRNLERRVELMFPVEQPDLRRRLVRILELYFADNCHSYELQPDGRYRKRRPPRRNQASAAARSTPRSGCSSRRGPPNAAACAPTTASSPSAAAHPASSSAVGRLRDTRARSRVLVQVERLATGDPGDVRPVGERVSELRIDYGPGYRVY